MLYTEERISELNQLSNEFRIKCMESVCEAGSGHIGGSFSAAEILTALYFEKLNIRPDDHMWADRDRFILSKGHIAPGLYTILAMRGYFPEEELMTLRKLDSRLLGHPSFKTPGVDMVSGSLGQGLSVGLGMSRAAKMKQKDFKIYVMLGDGEIQEGQVWEAAMAANHFGTDNLIAIVDYNKVQLDGTVDEIMDVHPMVEKWHAFGWSVIRIDGHDMVSVLDGLDQAEAVCKNGPVVIIADTVKGKGVSFMEGDCKWHGALPNEEEKVKAFNELNERLV